jgi:hypothetical protein
MRLRLVGEDDLPVSGEKAWLLASDVGIRMVLHNGFLDWIGPPDEPFAISVPGYACSERRIHRTGETIRLRGGHRVALRLLLDSARRWPPGCALRASVYCLERDYTGFSSDAIAYPGEADDRSGTALSIARNADVLVASTGRYGVNLRLVRWDADARRFDSFAVDVEPREFEVRAGGERTLVTMSSGFVEPER